MNPIELELPGGKPSGVFSCTECRLVCGNKDAAERCCACLRCGKSLAEMNAKTNCRHSYHLDCDDARREEIRARQFDKAEKLATWDGWISSDFSGPRPDGYAENIGDFVEWLEDQIALGDIELSAWPKFVFICDPVSHILDVDDILANFCDDGYEDMRDHLSGVQELRDAVDAFNKANSPVSWHTNYKKCIAVPPPSPEFLAQLESEKEERA